MAKIPQEILELFSDPQVAKVLTTIEPDGSLYLGVRGRFYVVDEEFIATADLAQIKRKPNFKANQEALIRVFKAPNHGYQIHGTFHGYQTSGTLFDEWDKQLKEGRHHITLERIGLIKADAIYTYALEDRNQFGMRIA